jgi:vancomycin resistance protein YoaR
VTTSVLPPTSELIPDGTADESADELGTSSEAAVGRRARPVRRFLVAFVASLLAVGALTSLALVAFGAAFEGRVLPGVRVGDVDLSGLDRAGAVTALDAAYADLGRGRIVIHTEAGDTSVPFRDFARRPDTEAMADAALAVGRAGDPLDQAVARVRIAIDGRVLTPQLTFDEASLATVLERRLARFEEEPVDARLSITRRAITVAPSRPGRTFDIPALQAEALAAVGRLDAPAQIELTAPAIIVPPALTDDTAQAAKAAADRVGAAIFVTDGKESWKIPASTVRQWFHLEASTDLAIRPVVDEAAVPLALTGIARVIEQKPISSTYLRSKAGRVVGVTASRDGRSLDSAATAAAIIQTLADRAAGSEAENVAAVVDRTVPELTTAEATQVAPLMTRLGSWKTWFPIGERNYWGANIWIPAQTINGTVLQPGQRFEWWSAVGTVSTAKGYGPGGLISGGRTLPTGSVGGGMCSSSTTLFNAALRAGLRMGARTNHAYYIDRYPLGLDATVYRKGGLTMSFTNDLKHPILIKGQRVGGSSGRGWVIYEIWGVDEGRQVSIGKPVVSNLRRATTQTIYTSRLPTGVREQTEVPANGMDVAVTRVVRDSAGRVIHRETFHSDYVLWNGRIEVGV